jgi:Antibiotic biosynthesis monooxygenase
MTGSADPQPMRTIAHWHVKPGAEGAFLAEWKQFSEWLLEHPGAESLALIKATDEAHQFVSLGVWSGSGSSAHWAPFLERLGRCRTLCQESSSHRYALEHVAVREALELHDPLARPSGHR